jgi:hypothetical protein
LVTVGTPVLAFAGALVGQLISRRGAVELEMRSRREEVMRNLRWAAELAVSPDDSKAQLGVAQLRSLFDSKIIGEDEKEFVLAALGVPIGALAAQIEQIEQRGEDVRVIEDPGLTAVNEVDLPSEPDPSVAVQPRVAEDEAEDEEGES